MKQFMVLRENWQIRSKEVEEEIRLKEMAGEPEADGWMEAVMPAQAHDVLLAHNQLRDPRILSNMEACQWVGKKDWIYRTPFQRPESGTRFYLHLKGLDTLCDVYLNGSLLASHEDQFIPLRLEVTDALQEQNDLLLHFKSPVHFIENSPKPEAWGESVSASKTLRKASEEFGTFLGAKPAFVKVGVFDEVILESADDLEIDEWSVMPSYSVDSPLGLITIEATGKGSSADAFLQLVVRDPSGDECLRQKLPLAPDDQAWKARAEIELQNPQLWWPRFYGPQNLYEVELVLTEGKTALDRVTRRIGFRDLEMESPFDFSVNGKKVKLWGANLCPTDGMSHVPNHERWMQTLDMVEQSNCVTVRAWGPGGPWPEFIYDECDRRGLLLWAEFFHTWGRYPDDDHYRELCRKEAEHYVKQHRHRPSIILWCGANETHMGAAMTHKDTPYFGEAIFEKDYREICKRLDPDRYYHPSSPSGGAFPNDPLEGDSHSYTHGYYLPGEEFPVLFSENTRIAPPQIHSVQRYLEGDEFWPEGFTGMIHSRKDTPMPPSWMDRTLGNSFWYGRPGPMGLFFDTGDTPEGLIYRMGAAYEHYLRELVERMRRGRRADEPEYLRRSFGHYLWKLNATWPQIYGEMIDYYLEPTMAFYAMKRIQEPVLLSFDVGWHVWLWLVNDTGRDVEGEVRFQLWDIGENRKAEERRRQMTVPSGASSVVMDLDEFGMIPQYYGLFAEFRNADGRIITRTNRFVDMERHIEFPEAELKLAYEDDALLITTDQFARCVHLTGDADGDAFGWFFEDNFFDLYPGEKKRVRLLGRHQKGEVSARSFWSPHLARVDVGGDD